MSFRCYIDLDREAAGTGRKERDAHTASRGPSMRFLLTFAGIATPSIYDARSISWANRSPSAAPSASRRRRMATPLQPSVGWRFISGNCDQPKSVGVLELTALS